HARVQACNLIVTVEHERWPLHELTQPALGLLAPTRMINIGVHIRIKAVLIRRRDVPGIHGLLFHEPDPHDSFGALETIFPRYNNAQGRSILIGKAFAIHTETKEGQGMHGLDRKSTRLNSSHVS